MGEFSQFGWMQSLTLSGPKYDFDLFDIIGGIIRIKNWNCSSAKNDETDGGHFENVFEKEGVTNANRNKYGNGYRSNNKADNLIIPARPKKLLFGKYNRSKIIQTQSVYCKNRGLAHSMKTSDKSLLAPPLEESNDVVARAGSSKENRTDGIINRRSWQENGTNNNNIEIKGEEIVSNKKKKGHVRSQSDVPVSILRAQSAVVSLGAATPSKLSSSSKLKEDPLKRRQSLLHEDLGVYSVTPKTECFFPQPLKGQSLTSFLSSDDFQICAELDKENAHFYISEALISAVEQIKCNQTLQRALMIGGEEGEEEEESDEEIKHLKQRIRIRRHEREREKAKTTKIVHHLLSDGCTDTTTTSQSPLSSEYTAGPSDDDDEETDSSPESVDEYNLSDANDSNLNSIQEKGFSLSMASLYSDADIKRFKECNEENSGAIYCASLTAEAVALCLIKKFTEKQLPKASDLEWLVSELDAPQQLLPLPDSWPVSPDIVEESISLQRTRLRGTMDWAPPRAQIIFNIHVESNRKVLVAKQKFRCAGCGMRIEKGYIQRFRFCKYLGKYFCQCCHANSTAIIPAHVLHKWDFGRYYVSNFSRDLLEQMSADPLFNIAVINANLFRKSRYLAQFSRLRKQLFYLKDFVSTCRRAVELKNELEKVVDPHWIQETELYSLNDLINLKNGRYLEECRKLTLICVNHVLKCTVCSGKGFLCEICQREDKKEKIVIFPFQLNKVYRCESCRSCYHKNCFEKTKLTSTEATSNGGKCPKCERIKCRKIKLAQEKEKENILSSSEDEN